MPATFRNETMAEARHRATVPANTTLPNPGGSQDTGWRFYSQVRASNAGFDGVLVR